MRQAIATLLLAISFAPKQAGPPAPTASIEGRVVDGAGRPLEGAVVKMNYVTSERMPAVITGADGKFRIAGLPAGTRQIQAEKPGYLQGGYGQMRPGGGLLLLPLAAGQRVVGITITLWLPAIISGRVLDEQSEPRAGVNVGALSMRSLAEIPYSGQPVGPMTQTNDRGEYELSLVPGRYAIVVPVSHVTWPLGTFADRNPMVVPTRPPTHVTNVVSADGRFSSELTDGLDPPPPVDGRARMYVTTFHPRGTTIVDATVFDIAAGESRPNVDVHLAPQPRVTIAGRAEGPSGPLAQVAIELLPDPKLLPMRLGVPYVNSHDDGTFEFMGVPPGLYRLVARRQLRDSDEIRTDTEGLNASMPLPVENKDITDLVVTLRPGVLVNGLIGTDGTSLPANARVTARLESLDERYRLGGATLPTPGDQFAITGVRPGRYVLKVNTPPGWFLKSAFIGTRDVSDEPLEVGEVDIGGIAVTLTDRPNEITGSISTIDGSSPRDAAVVLFPVDPSKRTSVDQFTRRVVAVRPGADGNYVFRNIPPGEYCVYALQESRMIDWPDPRFLDTIGQKAPHIPIAWNEHRAVNLFLSVQK